MSRICELNVLGMNNGSPKTKFPASIYAERLQQPTTRLNWRDAIAALSIPAIFILGAAITTISTSPVIGGIADTTLRLALACILLFVYRDVFVHNWKALKASPWKSALLVLVGAIALQVVVGVTRAALPTAWVEVGSTTPTGPETDITTAPWSTVAALAFISLGPLATVFIEEMVFRYTFFQRLPIWGSKLTITAALIINSIIFGAIHYYNFGGNLLATIPYMAAGALMNLSYLWTRNVWIPALMHLVNNAVLSIFGVILIVALRLIGVV